MGRTSVVENLELPPVIVVAETQPARLHVLERGVQLPRRRLDRGSAREAFWGQHGHDQGLAAQLLLNVQDPVGLVAERQRRMAAAHHHAGAFDQLPKLRRRQVVQASRLDAGKADLSEPLDHRRKVCCSLLAQAVELYGYGRAHVPILAGSKLAARVRRRLELYGTTQRASDSRVILCDVARTALLSRSGRDGRCR